MEYDGTEIIAAIKIVKEYLTELADKIKSFFKDNEDLFLRMNEIIKDFYKKENNKVKHKPILEIKPKKELLINKRINNHYCRNNC